MLKVDCKTPYIFLDKSKNCLLCFSDLDNFLQYVTPSNFLDGIEIVKHAFDFVGKEFRPGQTEQCCNFVREILQRVGCNVGTTSHPSDGTHPVYPGYANSLAGDDIGAEISFADLLQGDIIFFKNTYGDWPEGTITHIGIFVGDNSFIHRSTSLRPVEHVEISDYWRKKFVEGRRIFKA